MDPQGWDGTCSTNEEEIGNTKKQFLSENVRTHLGRLGMQYNAEIGVWL
jgi:hypothetical protein